MVSLNTSLPVSHEKPQEHKTPVKAGSIVKQFGTAVALALALHAPAYAAGGQETAKTSAPASAEKRWDSPDNTVEIDGKTYTYEEMFRVVITEKKWDIVEKVRKVGITKYAHVRGYVNKRLDEDIARLDEEGVIIQENLARAIAEGEPITREYIAKSYLLMDQIEKNPNMLKNPNTRALLSEIIEDTKYIPEDLRNRGNKVLQQGNYMAKQ